MEVTIRRDKNKEWGFVESFQKYQALDKGNIKVITSVSPEGKFAKPYVFRGGEFVPLEIIDQEIGISKYLKAKKPFYSRLTDGFIVYIKAGVDYEKKEFLPESTEVIVYKTFTKVLSSPNEGKLLLVRVLDVPDRFSEMLNGLAKKVSECYGDRESFLKDRL